MKTGSIVFWISLLVSTVYARDKTPYQSTKLLELATTSGGFCFVVQVDDLAYLADAPGGPGLNLVVGDPAEIKIKNENIWIKVKRKYPIGSDTYVDQVKGRIAIRKRMTEGQKLPSCAFAVSVH